MTNIEWYYPEYGKGPDKSINDIVSHIPGVERAVFKKATTLGAQAHAQLLGHHRTGSAKVTVEKHPRASSRTPDWYVYLKDADPGGEGIAGKNKRDRSAMSIEFGWTQTHAWGRKLAEPIKHDGLGILNGVMARAAKRYAGPQ